MQKLLTITILSIVIQTYLLMSVSFPDVDTGQVGYNVCPQLLVCSELKNNNQCVRQEKRIINSSSENKGVQRESLKTHPQGCGELCLCIIHAVDWDTVETLGNTLTTIPFSHSTLTYRSVLLTNLLQKLCWFNSQGECGAEQHGWWTAWGIAGRAGTPARSTWTRSQEWGDNTGQEGLIN